MEWFCIENDQWPVHLQIPGFYKLLPSIANIQNAQLSPGAWKHLVWGKRSLLPRASHWNHGLPMKVMNIVQRMPRSVDALPWICMLGFSWTFNCNVWVCQTVKTNPTRLVTIRMGKQKDTTWVWQLLKPKLPISRNRLWWPHIVGFWLSVKFQGSKTLLPYYVRTFCGHFLGYIPCSCRFRNSGNLEPIPEK